MFKNIYLKVLLILSLFAISNNTWADKDKVIIGGEENYPPFEYVDEDGEYRGFNVDLMRALSLEMGIEIKLVPMDWVDLHTSLQNGEIDAIQGMNYNNNRREIYEFSDEYLQNSLVTFVREKERDIFGIDNLKNKRVAVQRSDFASYALAELGEIEVVFFSDLNEGFEQLLLNEVDAVVGNKHTGLYLLEKNNTTNLIKPVGNDIYFTSYGLAFKKGNTELSKEFNQGINSLKRKGTYYQIYENWFGKEKVPPWKNLVYILYVLIIIIIIIAILNLFYIKINKLLKKRIEQGTIDLRLVNQELEASRQKLKESDKYKEEVLNGIGNGLITFDNNGIVTTVNKSCERLLQIDSRELLGKNYKDVSLDKYIDIGHLQRCLNHEEQFTLFERTFYRDDKENILSYILKPLFDLNHINIGAVLTFNNITEVTVLRRKLAENSKMTSLGALISRISHEIRNPLTSIKAYTDLLPLKYDNEKFRDKITSEIPLEIERLNNLLTNLIDYSKPKNFIKEAFDIVYLVKQIIILLEAEIESKNIKISFTRNEPTIVYGDMQQVKQIIINILKNSIDALEGNGTIDISLNESQERPVLTLSDNGKGISKEDLNTIFDPFFTTKSQGTGLGLAICHQLARENNISITIDSELSEFTKVALVFNNIDKDDLNEKDINY